MNIDGRLFTRLIYLLHTNKDLRIPKQLTRYLPGGDWISVATQQGVGAADVNMGIYTSLLEEGSKAGPGDSQEGAIIVQKLIDNYLRGDTKLDTNTRLKVYRMLEGLRAMMSEQTVIFDLDEPQDIEPIYKFDTGFQPFDAVIGGFYQGIFLLMGPPGSGKTSLMVAMSEAVRQSGHQGSILMLQNEVASNMMIGRFNDILRRTKFNKGDKLICGPWGAHHILDWIKENPDPERIILFDGPDVIRGSDNYMGAKAYIADEYITLIEIKSLCKMVVVSGWPNRKEAMITHLNQVGDAIEKARYADCIIGINPMANNSTQLLCLKNRFGPPEGNLTFNIDMETLTWSPGDITTEASFWEDLQAEQESQAETNGRA